MRNWGCHSATAANSWRLRAAQLKPDKVFGVQLASERGRADQIDEHHGYLRLLRQYREACVAAVGKYDGYIAQYLGDGILVYFGFPLALEHAAELAVRAGVG